MAAGSTGTGVGASSKDVAAVREAAKSSMASFRGGGEVGATVGPGSSGGVAESREVAGAMDVAGAVEVAESRKVAGRHGRGTAHGSGRGRGSGGRRRLDLGAGREVGYRLVHERGRDLDAGNEAPGVRGLERDRDAVAGRQAAGDEVAEVAARDFAFERPASEAVVGDARAPRSTSRCRSRR